MLDEDLWLMISLEVMVTDRAKEVICHIWEVIPST